MAEADIDRKIKQEGDKYIINSDVKEVLDQAEYVSVFNRKHAALQEVLDGLHEGKTQLNKMEIIEETEELATFVKMMLQAEQIKKRQKLIKDLRDMEINENNLRKEVVLFTPTMLRIQKQQKEKKENDNSGTKNTEQKEV